MSRINVLDKHVAELIAAGEVVERPSSVIKELVENSIDAGSSNITVEIKNGGKTFIRVADNGCGIERDDVKIAFLRHATSKVKVENDLDSIATLGFRGEALASVSAVANVELITCADTEETGTLYRVSAGEELELSDIGCPKGTTIIVRDLFFNIPARQKFLKKDVSEGNAIAQVIDRIALSHPEIAFTFIRDSKVTLKTSGDGKLSSAIYSVFGRDFANSMIEVDYKLGPIEVKGYISKPESARPTRSMQTFFVNGRFVKTRTAAAAVDEAAKGSVMVGKFLSCVLNLSMSFSAVDVNVHPAKIEVRFVNERPIFDAVYHAVKSALLTNDERKKVQLFSNAAEKPKIEPFTYSTVKSIKPEVTEVKKPQQPSASSLFAKPQSKPLYERTNSVSDVRDKTDAFLKSLEVIKKEETERNTPLDIFDDVVTKTIPQESATSSSVTTPLPETEEIAVSQEVSRSENIEEKPVLLDNSFEKTSEDFKFVGEAFSTYIIVEIDNKLMLVDKHALHERIIYERLKSEGNTFSQMLLMPVTVTLQKDEYNAALENLEVFATAAFEVEDFGNGTLLVRSCPQFLDSADVESSIAEMSCYLSQNKLDINTEKMDWIFHNIACRAAVKAGNKSKTPELIDLVKQMLSNPTLKTCPHGRPVCIELTKNEIEKQFGRV
ncbi:MAG: DNA mismatch repair endonuclease MutL [Ruminococcus sp.]|nr:DNA mismatch repair endonuclease MutL [Ruminococcus sp.]